MKRKMFTVLAVMAITVFPLYAQSESDFEVQQNKDNTLTITKYNGAAKDLVIPDTLYGLKVTIIGERVFWNKGLTSVVIPNTVITIEYAAFVINKKLTTVVLGNRLKTIGEEAFFGCSNLAEIVIPNSVTSIGGGILLLIWNIVMMGMVAGMSLLLVED